MHVYVISYITFTFDFPHRFARTESRYGDASGTSRRRDTNELSGQRSFRHGCRRLSPPVFICELFSEPEIVVFFRPAVIDFAGTHGLERTFHADRADIDVGKDQGNEQNGYDGMYDLRKLHPDDVHSVKRKQQQEPRYGNRDARRNRKPVDKLLAKVKASGRRMFFLDEPPTLLDPIEVDFFETVVPEEDYGDKDEADREREAGRARTLPPARRARMRPGRSAATAKSCQR